MDNVDKFRVTSNLIKSHHKIGIRKIEELSNYGQLIKFLVIL